MSFNEWQEFTLGEITTYISRGITPSYTEEENGIIVLNQRCIRDGKVLFSEARKHDIGKKDVSEKKKLQSFDILINSTGVGTLGRVSQIQQVENIITVDSHVTIVRPCDTVSPIFLGYLLKSNQSIIESLATGSTGQTELPREGLVNLEFKIPVRIETQERIGSILSSLDDKIENNLATNQTLEEIARTLFKEWFVNFNYPGADGKMKESELGLIPEGWGVGSISNYFDFVIGGDWGKDEFDDKHTMQCVVIRGTDINDMLLSNFSKIPIRYIQQSKFEKRKLMDGDIVFEISGGSKDQATGRNLLITEELLKVFDLEVIPASFCRVIRAKTVEVGYFLGTFLRIYYDDGQTWHYQLQSTGIANFQFEYFSNNCKLITPPQEVINNFYQIVKPFYAKIFENIQQTQTLKTLRDSLLPKLMSGAIDVNNIKI